MTTVLSTLAAITAAGLSLDQMRRRAIAAIAASTRAGRMLPVLETIGAHTFAITLRESAAVPHQILPWTIEPDWLDFETDQELVQVSVYQGPRPAPTSAPPRSPDPTCILTASEPYIPISTGLLDALDHQDVVAYLRHYLAHGARLAVIHESFYQRRIAPYLDELGQERLTEAESFDAMARTVAEQTGIPIHNVRYLGKDRVRGIISYDSPLTPEQEEQIRAALRAIDDTALQAAQHADGRDHL